MNQGLNISCCNGENDTKCVPT